MTFTSNRSQFDPNVLKLLVPLVIKIINDECNACPFSFRATCTCDIVVL